MNGERIGRGERRKHLRQPAHGIADLIVDERGRKKKIVAVVRNVSEGGLGVFSYNFIEVGSRITQVHVQGRNEIRAVDGLVVWLSTREHRHVMGLRFQEELDSEKDGTLYEFLLRGAGGSPIP